MANGGRMGTRLLAALLAAACALPVLTVHYPPLQDFPWHLALSEIVRAPEKFGGAFEADLRPGPYAGFYWLVQGLASALPVLLAGKLIVALTAAAIPLSVLFFLASTGERPGWVRFAAFPIVFSQIYYLGFVSFLLALPIYFLGLGALVLFLRGRHRRAAAAAALVAGPLLCLAHPIGVALYSLSATIVAAWHARTLRDDRRALLVAITAAVLVPALAFLPAVTGVGRASALGPQFVGPLFTARFFIDLFAGVYTPRENLASAAGYALVAVGAFLGARRADRRGRPFLAESLSVACVLALLMFVLPFRLGNAAHYLNVRLAPVVALWIVIAASLVSRPGNAPRGEPALVLAGCALALGCAWSAHARFDAEARTAEPVFAAMKPGARVLPLCFARSSRVFAPRHWNELYLHFHDYYLLEKGGVDPYLLSNPLFPVTYRGEPLDAPGEYRPERFRWDRHGGSFDYFLIRGPVRGKAKEELETYTRPVARSSPWLVTEPASRE